MNNFARERVLALETRRSKEIAALIKTYGGEPLLAPAMREIPLESNREAADFVGGLMKSEFDLVIFLTGVGTRWLAEIAKQTIPLDRFVAALRRVQIVARGPKPTAALKEIGVIPNAVAPEPNTWRELLSVLDSDIAPQGLQNLRVAVQEYGEPAEELLSGLKERGARLTRVPVYRWAMPEDLEPLRSAISELTQRKITVALFTTSVQIIHLFTIAEGMGLEQQLQSALKQCVIASIGPTTSEELRRRGLPPDLEATHPKMGVLVKEASEKYAELIRAKRSHSAN